MGSRMPGKIIDILAGAIDIFISAPLNVHWTVRLDPLPPSLTPTWYFAVPYLKIVNTVVIGTEI